LVEDALCKDLNIDLGINYFGTAIERVKKIIESTDVRVPTYFPVLDEYLNGGLPPYTLTVAAAKVHGFKSAFLANISARQVLHGHNVVIASMEMSETAFAQRYDALFSLMDINKIYKERRTTLAMMKKITELRDGGTVGNLYIKQYPTGAATVEDFRKYLRELIIRGIKPSIFFCDYLNIMKPAYKTKGDMYSDVKAIAEELRALSFEFVMPVVTVSQLNREGARIGFNEIDFTYISESMGTIATADAVIIFGDNEEQAAYESELWYKIAKNRLGGRVGEINKFYVDQRTLKMYCDSELGLWMDESAISGDTRNLAEPAAPVVENRGARGRNATRPRGR
jgi:replicative DNA helicase